MKAAVLALLLLSACGHTQVVYQPVNVDVPVPVPCKVAAVPVPAWPTANLPQNASLFDHAKAVLSELKLRAAYEAKLVAVNNSCQ